MKEYQSHGGGRPLYNDDIKNLQELALAFSSFFMDCGLDFVITGCSVTNEGENTYIEPGYVWLNGRVLKLVRTNVTGLSAPYYIVPVFTTPAQQIIYADNTVGYNCIDYHAEVRGDGQAIPEKFIRQNGDGVFPNLRNTFFSYYTIIKNDGEQKFPSRVTFSTIAVANMILGPNSSAEILVEEGNAVVIKMKEVSGNRLSYKFGIKDAKLSVFNNDELVWEFAGAEPLDLDDIFDVTGPDPDNGKLFFDELFPMTKELIEEIIGEESNDFSVYGEIPAILANDLYEITGEDPDDQTAIYKFGEIDSIQDFEINWLAENIEEE